MVLTLLFNALLVDRLPERQVEVDEQPRNFVRLPPPSVLKFPLDVY
jgi:hypothetical protein